MVQTGWFIAEPHHVLRCSPPHTGTSLSASEIVPLYCGVVTSRVGHSFIRAGAQHCRGHLNFCESHDIKRLMDSTKNSFTDFGADLGKNVTIFFITIQMEFNLACTVQGSDCDWKFRIIECDNIVGETLWSATCSPAYLPVVC